MSLVKEVCRRCMGEEKQRHFHWNDLDAQRWQHGRLHCLQRPLDKPFLLIKDGVPKWCRYFMEQVVLSQNLVLNQEQEKPCP